MNDEEIKQKGDELLEILQDDLIKHIQGLLEISTKIKVTKEEAKVMLAKIGKKLMLEIIKKA